MALTDNDDLRSFLTRIYPGLIIDNVPAPSGQRIVYFCHFTERAPQEWQDWGNVVLKISEGISAQAIAYIQREIEILNDLSSPGYPTLYFNDVVTEDPDTEEKLKYRVFITIEEMIESQPLNEVADRFNTEESVIDLLIKLIHVLKPLWEWKPPLVHRDLKPQNILITPNNDVVVIDLGLLREEGADGVTLSINSFGPCTPMYASPEQANNDKRNISFKSDFFSLGIICYELLSKTNPFSKNTNLLDEILANVIAYTPDSLSKLNLCSEEFSLVIEKMMHKKQYQRYRKIDDLLQSLESLIK